MPATAIALALASAGCSMQLGSLLDQNDTQVTGSIPSAGGKAPVPPGTAERDLAYARAAAADVLDRGGKDTSMPWENPGTGARGTVTPIATAYTQDGVTCRDFLASYVSNGSEAWLQGEACRQRRGKWEVRSLKPLNR